MSDLDWERDRRRGLAAQERSASANERTASANEATARAAEATARAQARMAARQEHEFRIQSLQRDVEEAAATILHDIEVAFRIGEGVADLDPLDAYIRARATALRVQTLQIESIPREQRSTYAQLVSGAQVLKMRSERVLSETDLARVDEYASLLGEPLIEAQALSEIHSARAEQRTMEWGMRNLEPKRADYAEAVIGCAGVLVRLPEDSSRGEAEWGSQLDLILTRIAAVPASSELSASEWEMLKPPQAASALLHGVKACARAVVSHPSMQIARRDVEGKSPYFVAAAIAPIALAASLFANWGIGNLVCGLIALGAFPFARLLVRISTEEALAFVAVCHGVRTFLERDAALAASALALFRRARARAADDGRHARMAELSEWIGTRAPALESLAIAQLPAKALPSIVIDASDTQHEIDDRRTRLNLRPIEIEEAQTKAASWRVLDFAKLALLTMGAFAIGMLVFVPH